MLTKVIISNDTAYLDINMNTEIYRDNTTGTTPKTQ